MGVELEAGRPVKRTGFSTTRWSVIVSSADLDADEVKSQQALGELCDIYWRPVFSFICWRGTPLHDAEDLTQDFFRMILQPEWLRNVDQRRGRFRSLLLRSLENFVRDKATKQKRQRRGGGAPMKSWDRWMTEAPSAITMSAPALQTLPPQNVFDFRWAVTVLEEALRRLAEECERKQRRRLFASLSPFLTAERDANYASLGRELGLQEHEVKKQLHTMRLRYRRLLREEVARTLQDPSDIDDEIRNLCAALAQGGKEAHAT